MKRFLIVFLILISTNVFAQLRSLNDIFPNINSNVRDSVLGSGYLMSSRRTSGFNILANNQGVGLNPQIVNMVMQRNPGYITESIIVIPNPAGTAGRADSAGSATLLDI